MGQFKLVEGWLGNPYVYKVDVAAPFLTELVHQNIDPDIGVEVLQAGDDVFLNLDGRRSYRRLKVTMKELVNCNAVGGFEKSQQQLVARIVGAKRSTVSDAGSIVSTLLVNISTQTLGISPHAACDEIIVLPLVLFAME